MNPFDADAVFDVALFTQDRPPTVPRGRLRPRPARSVPCHWPRRLRGERRSGQRSTSVSVGWRWRRPTWRPTEGTERARPDGARRLAHAPVRRRIRSVRASRLRARRHPARPGDPLSAKGLAPGRRLTEVAQVAASVKSSRSSRRVRPRSRWARPQEDGLAGVANDRPAEARRRATQGAAVPAASWVVLPTDPPMQRSQSWSLVNSGSRASRVELRSLPRPGGESVEAVVEVPRVRDRGAERAARRSSAGRCPRDLTEARWWRWEPRLRAAGVGRSRSGSACLVDVAFIRRSSQCGVSSDVSSSVSSRERVGRHV